MIRDKPASRIHGVLLSILAGTLVGGVTFFASYKYYKYKELQEAESGRSKWAKEFIEQAMRGV